MSLLLTVTDYRDRANLVSRSSPIRYLCRAFYCIIIHQGSPGLQNYSMIDPLSQPSNQQPKQTLSQPPQSQTPSAQSYLQQLLSKHSERVGFVQSYTAGREQECQTQILKGRYSIRKLEWSAAAEQQKLKASRQLLNKNASEMFRARRQLEDQIKHVEEELEGAAENKQLSQEQRAAFLKRIEKERKQLAQKRQQYLRAVEAKKQEEARKAQQQQEKQQNQKRQRKQQQIAERLRQQQEVRKKKEQDYKNQTQILKQKMREKTTATKIQQSYNLRQNQSLQQRKKRLAQIRMLHKPIDRKQLDAHAEKLQQFHAQRIAANTERINSNEKPTLPFYKSIFYRRVKEEQKVFADRQEEEQLGKLRENREKLKKFAEQIRQNFKPTIDEKKVEELKFRSVNFKSRASSTKARNESAQKIGLRYLQFSKAQGDHQRLLVSQNHTEEEEQQKQKKNLDYLAELRQKGKNRTSQSAHQLLNKLDKVSIPKEEKMKKILEFTQKIQRSAKRKEQLQKFNGGKPDDQLDALYLQAIQAKLGLLEDY